MQHIDSDLIRGNIDTIILKTMLNEDKYGLDIIKEVGEKSSGTYELKQPTLYSCLKRLENQELISSYWVDSDIGGRRHYYKLTDKGREFYNKKQEEWAKSKFIIDNLLSNYDYEEYRLVKKDEFDDILKQKANAPLSNFTSVQTEDQTEDEKVPNDNLEFSETEETSNQTEVEESEQIETEELDEPEIIETNDEYQNEFESTENYEADDDFEDNNDFSQFETIEDLETYLRENSNSDDDDDDEDVFNLGENNSLDEFENDAFDDENDSISEPEDNDYPVYFSAKPHNLDASNPNNVSYETSDQSSNELNILNRLRGQEDEEINTYYGDQKSYVNHLNQLDECKHEQQDLLDSSLYVKPDLVNKSIDEFTEAIDRLNNFSSESNQTEDDVENVDVEFENMSLANLEPLTTQTQQVDDNIDDLEELEKLKNLSSNAFFYSNDNSAYNEVAKSQETSFTQSDSNDDYEPENYSFNEISSQSFEEISNEIEPRHEEYSIETSEDSSYENNYESFESDNHFDDIDTIISNNITATYPEPTQHFYKTQSVNYREKLSDLSKYSKVTLDEEKTEVSNSEAIEKAKDIAEITKELEEEGIRIKEHYKSTNLKGLDKNYLLSNKINLMKSLIMFFGYVFVLSALYIVLNNTSMKDSSWFSITPFLIGFIPFALILIYRGIIFAINPYKKVDAKYHARIMMFISIIITIQLLLITYCVNLQLGFYSFAQKGYNHLFWIIPTIISFSPIIDNLVYIALFKSKNFNV